ncbi:hypothetical protein [Flagellimonas maritima]|uniref:hypothetical protein n=1 Tax=Flagellimonas maritima TaxID=1383885 RepID=UPI000DDBD245|nr:hypothetical protein [Allomuricauda aurantiaca]
MDRTDSGSSTNVLPAGKDLGADQEYLWKFATERVSCGHSSAPVFVDKPARTKRGKIVYLLSYL